MVHILILSAHEGQLDRRILSEANALVESGRNVTLLSVPTRIEIAGLDERIRLVVQQQDKFESPSPARSAAHLLPKALYDMAKSLWYLFGSGPAPHNTAYFLRHVPEGAFDAIHCHDLKTLPAGVEIRRRYCPQAKLIYDSHEYFPFQSLNRSFQYYWKKIERKAIVEADLSITINDSISEAMANLYNVRKPKVLYNSYEAGLGDQPISESDFLSHFGASRSENHKILFQGNFSPERNLRRLVQAFELLQGRAELFLLGDGVERAKLQRICTEKGIHNVHFGSWVAQERLMGFVRRADLGVIPYLGHESLNSLYCTPNKLFEYIEAGIPICASDLCELRRIIRGYGIGDVYAMGTIRQIAESITDCLGRLEKGEFSPDRFAKARDYFSWQKQVEHLLFWYEELGI